MSGGIAYVWDEDERSRARVNREMVDLEDLADPADVAELRALIEEHARLTGSPRAQAHPRRPGTSSSASFVKVMPRDYKRALAELAAAAGSAASGRRAPRVGRPTQAPWPP